MTGWQEWYNRARVKSTYKDQLDELCQIIKTHVPKFESILDIGCGDCRLKDRYEHVKYLGLDKEYNDFDLLKEDWSLIDVSDLGVCNLVLMLFNEEDAKKIFEQTLNKCKWVVLFEENIKEEESVSSEGKWNHNYSLWNKDIIVWGDSKNPSWKWYVFKGRVR
jgi:hypothetical protein